jgi:NTE family protein
MKKINIVLSGGGARGVAHAGVLKALIEHDFQIGSISGVSAGAIVGALIAKGLSPDQILDLASKDSFFRSWNPPFHFGVFRKSRMEQMLAYYFPEDSFSELHTPLFISATNINTSQTDYFSSGELVKPLLASSALPLLFSPVVINGYQYLDGGMINNFPIEPFVGDPAPLVGIHVNPVSTSSHFKSTYRIVERSLELAAHKNVQWRKKQCQLVIEPEELARFSVYDFGKAKDIFETGYEFACIVLEKLISESEEFEKWFRRKSAA